MIHSFPKIFAIGTDYIHDIFKGEVEITEKVDGSQFAFGKINGERFYRSKGQQLFPENPEKMFAKGVEYVESIELPDDIIFYCEYLKTERHNNLEYERIPKNHLALFGACIYQKFINDHSILESFAENLNIDVVPLVYKGKIKSAEKILKFIERESFLGKAEIEGIVVKNYNMPFLLGGQPIPIMMGKYVSEKYKEVAKDWNKRNTGKGKWDIYKDAFRTEARWLKSIQHAKEDGLLDNSPKDIGMLIKMIQQDITEEEKENIKEFLWNEFGKEALRKSTAGFPEWYKEQLLKKSFKKQ